MKDKYYEFTGLIVMGLLLIILGVVLFVGRNITYQYFVSIVILLLWMNAFRAFVKLFFRRLNKREEVHSFLSCLFHFIVCVVLVMLPNFALGFVPFVFSIYLIIMGITQIIMCLLEIRNMEYIQIGHIFTFIFCFVIGIPILFSPVGNINSFLFLISIYCILLGISMLWDSICIVLSYKVKNQLKRHIRITLPKFVESFIPYSVMLEINRNLSLEKKQTYSFDKNDNEVNLNILIHTSHSGVNRMGHMDLCFEGRVYSFGNYDEGSRIFHDVFGDGVLFVTSRKEDYINFCINHSKKTIFDFGICLNDKQKSVVRKRIKDIMSQSYVWNYKNDIKYLNGQSYASKLYKKTKAKFYKFSSSKYRTYFVLWTNCCYLVDDVVGGSGMDILSINGIITPGTYYDYLNRELMIKNSCVISKEIYNDSRMASKVIKK